MHRPGFAGLRDPEVGGVSAVEPVHDAAPAAVGPAWTSETVSLAGTSSPRADTSTVSVTVVPDAGAVPAIATVVEAPGASGSSQHATELSI